MKLGPTAFQDDSGEWFKNVTIKEGDWIVSRPSDGWTITINNVPCRILSDVNVRGRIQDVDQVW